MNGKGTKVKDVSIDDAALTVWLSDGRVVSTPLDWYPSLLDASRAERKRWKRSGAGYGIHWPALDYDLSVAGMLEGRKEHPNALRLVREVRANRQGSTRVRSRRKVTRPVAA